MAGFDLTYDDYLKGREVGDQSAFSESGTSNLTNQLSEDDWNKLSQDQKWQELYANRAPMQLEPDDPRIGDLQQRTGSSGGVSILHGPPEMVHLGDSQWWKDPSKVVDLGNNTYAVSGDNLTAFAKAEKHKKGIGDLIGFGIPLAIITAGAASAAFGGEAGAAGGVADTAGASTAETQAAIDAANGVSATTAETQAAIDAANGVTATTEGATAGASTAETQAAIDTANGVSGVSTATTGSSGGIVDGVRGAVTSIGDWYNSLSPASRLIIGTAISQGASAAFAQHRQSQLVDRANQQTDQQREDQVRRHYVPSFGDNAFKPRGIIDGQRNGG